MGPTGTNLIVKLTSFLLVLTMLRSVVSPYQSANLPVAKNRVDLQLLIDSIPALIHTSVPDGYLYEAGIGDSLSKMFM